MTTHQTAMRQDNAAKKSEPQRSPSSRHFLGNAPSYGPLRQRSHAGRSLAHPFAAVPANAGHGAEPVGRKSAPNVAWDFSSIPVLPVGMAGKFLSGLTAQSIPSAQRPRLAIGAIDDPREREADVVSERVMDPSSRAGVTLQRSDGKLQRKCSACEEEEKKGQKLARKESAAVSTFPSTVPSIVYDVLQSPGTPLDTGTRTFMESRFGHDFRQVRVHTDGLASQSAEAVAARAYTVGRNVVFRAGEYAPGVPGGQQLLAHELAHVVQQGAVGARAPVIQRQPAGTPPMSGNQNMGGGATPASSNGCHTCNLGGQIYICCLSADAPLVPECFELGKRIIDACPGRPTSCLEEAQCAQCRCIAEKRGDRYCQCSGLV